jgi:epoxyqueuosine reductase
MVDDEGVGYPSFRPEAGADSASSLTRDQARSLALDAGFAAAGLVALPHAHEDRDAARFNQWLRQGRAGSMNYLKRTADPPAGESGPPIRPIRSRVRIPFPWARTALVCFANYNSAQPLSTAPAPADAGWIARYAWSSRQDAAGHSRPSDYHKVLLKRLKSLEARLHEQFGAFESRAYVDTGPVVERALATAAGLGWTGKNTCLIHPRLGSFGFLAVLLTSLDLQEEKAPPALPDRCGSCRRCLDACPTGALVAPYQMDAARCISYLTIEHKGAIEPELMGAMGRQVLGCDICQDVCPWNRKSPISVDPDLAARPELVNPALDWLAEMDEPEFERRFNGSPVRRAGFPGLRRNVAIAMGNSGLRRFQPLLEKWAQQAGETAGETPAAQGLRAAAQWALKKLRVAPR